MEEILKQIALENRTTVGSVKKEIEFAIHEAMNNSQTDSKNFWNELSYDGNRTVKYASSKRLVGKILEKYPHNSNKENRPYAPPGEYGESSAPPVSVAILNAVKQELDKHETELRTQSTFEQIRNSIKAN